MRLTWVKASRLPRVPLWALLVGGLWTSLVSVSVFLELRTGTPLETCLFRRMTGRPCPTCGSTRAVLSLAAGHFWEAFEWNPLVVAGLLWIGGLLLLRLATQRAPSLVIEKGEAPYILALGIALLALNWAWVWRVHP